MNIPIYSEGKQEDSTNFNPLGQLSTTGELRLCEKSNTGSSQTSGGEYLLEGDSMSSRDMQQPEEKIGIQSFVPIQLLGKGSFGEVYLVQKKTNCQHYAMKVLSKTKIMGQNLVRYAKTERNVLSYT